jgi:epidermal growth factor receptor substrate 15
MTTVVSRAGLAAVALVAPSCTESVSPERSRDTPSFSYSSNGITLSKSVGLMGYNGQLIIKGFNGGNPHHGDAVIATFFWVSATSTNIIDSVVDVLTTNPYTRVGNSFTLVEFARAGNYSMATYIATNIQNFPDPNTDPGGGDIYAVGAYLRESISAGGVTLSAWTGVEDNSTLVLGQHNSRSGSGTEPMFAHADPIGVNAGALVYTVTMSGLWGLERPQGYASTGQGASGQNLKQDAAFAVQTAAGTVDPQWGWFFGSSGDTWLVTTLALNSAQSPQSSPGDLAATTTTSGGASMDPDGYTVTVDAGASQTIAVNGSVTFGGVAAGDHDVALSGLATNCTLSSANPQTVSVPSGGTATAAFTVDCAATTGDLTVNTTSTGSDIPSTYTLSVDGGSGQAIASTGTTILTALPATNHSVALAVPANCSVNGANPQTVSVPSGGTATAAFSVNCVPLTGDLTVNTTSTGSSIPSTYSVSVDGGTGQTIASTGSATFTALSATNHTVALSVPSNCTVSDGASRTVTVPAGGTATVSYAVNCVTPPGNLAVNTSSSGADIPSSYTATVDGSQTQSIASSGSVTFTNLSAGTHTLVLSVPANCTVSGGTSRTVSVPSGGTATVSYSVSCNAPPVVNAGPDETALTGLLYTLRWSFTDANHNGPWTYTINWGDGTTSSGTVSSEGSFNTGHTYVILLPRSFTVRVTVRDANGAAASDTKVVSVLLL